MSEERYAWHFKPLDMIRARLDEIVSLLEQILIKLNSEKKNGE